MRKLISIVIICLTSLLFSVAFATEPQNAGALKQAIVKYYESGEYGQDVTKATDEAQNYLQAEVLENAKASKKQKLAMVFDIDDTAIMSYDCLKKINFGGTLDQAVACIQSPTNQAIPQTLNLYKFAKSHNIAVFFITGRKQEMLKQTEETLKADGYENWDGLYMIPNTYTEKSRAPFKTSIRKQLVDQGYDIVLNMGDQDSDFIGGYSDKNLKLPNPMYFIP